jgi:site-specific DNA-methyltransferase (adenine-specific)
VTGEQHGDRSAEQRLQALERSRLAELEQVVERGLDTFMEVGLALREIRDGRLYRETYSTFERYLDERWGMGRAHGYRLIEGARVAELVSPMGDIPNERQARELVPLLRTAGETEFVDVVRRLEAEFPGQRLPPERVERLLRRRLERVQREDACQQRFEAAEAVFGDVTIRHGDFRHALADLDGKVDAIITDPPYAPAWISSDAAEFAAAAARILTPAGTLVVMFGVLHYELKAQLDQHLRYRWTGVYLTPGWHGRMFTPRVATGWKPLLLYTRRDAPTLEYLCDDVFVSEARDKDHHEWGQSESGMTRIVERLTRPGELVVDPFLGGGTTAIVCSRLGRRFVGCDVDPAAVETTRRRLAQAGPGLPGGAAGLGRDDPPAPAPTGAQNGPQRDEARA